MSTSLLYHGFGIRGYRHEKAEYVEMGVVFCVTQPGSLQEAHVFLQDWIAQAKCSGIRMLVNFAITLRIHAWGIRSPISTGPLEGTNNKTKTLKRQAYGFRDAEFLKFKIYTIHESKYALVG